MSYLYLHVPFCTSICYYCDFKRSIYDTNMVDAWLKEINKECLLKVKNNNLKTIYLGGGTPSCLNERQLEELLSYLDRYRENIEEYTIESNLESLTQNKVALMIKHGINRISLGVQSLQDDLLKQMNRKHTANDVLEMLEKLYLWGMHNISVDLIYGFENQKLSTWMDDLQIICKHPYVKHISLYSLTIEENSVFYKQHRKNCSNELEALMYENAIHILEQHGFKQYEIANFAKQGYASIHNQAYWHYDDFYGIGVGASGKSNSIRYTNTGVIQDYIQGIRHVKEEHLSKEDMMFENIMMSLRLKEGMCISKYDQTYHVSFLKRYEKAIRTGIMNNELIIENDFIKTTKQGMFYLHDVLIRFMD